MAFGKSLVKAAEVSKTDHANHIDIMFNMYVKQKDD